LISGAGADTFEGGLDFDIVTYRTATAAVTLNLAEMRGNPGSPSGNDILAEDTEGLDGSKFDDTLAGGVGADKFKFLVAATAVVRQPPHAIGSPIL